MSFPITIVRTAGKAGAITVDYRFVAGTASEGSDFQLTTGTISIGSGESSKVFQISVINDTVAESSETFEIVMSNPTGGAVILSDRTTINITDDDGGSSSSGTSSVSSSSSSITGPGAFKYAAIAYSVGENIPSVTVTVTRVNGIVGTVGVSYATTTSPNYTATGSDYAATSGTLTFAAGETTKTFSVPISDDGTIDGNKTFAVTLSAPTGGATIDTPSTVVTIYDDETAAFGSGTFRFAQSSYNVTEGSGKATVIVNRVGGSKGTATVMYSTANNTALSGADYAATSGTLTFQQGEASKTFEVILYKDNQANEGEETVSLMISSPTGAMLGDLTTSTLTISG